jgi:4-aminobutyrate aminotransferase-like enzyme
MTESAATFPLMRRIVTDEVPGPRSRQLLEQAAAQEGPAVARQSSVAWARAQGVYVEDADGNVFLDFSSSVLVANVGHRHPHVAEAIRDQAQELLHCYNFVNSWRVELGRRLLELAQPHGLERVFIGSTGAEVVELALKLARWRTGRSGTLALEGGYHGKTIAATAVGGRPESREGLGDLLPGVVHLPFPLAGRSDSHTQEEAALRRLAKLENSGAAEAIGTVIIEALQGNAGQRQTSGEFLRAIEDFARRHEAVFVIDEVQSSFGRAGTMFAFEQFGLRPDLVVAGKGISSSLPLTIMLGRAEVFDAAPERSLSSTHGGNPVVCRAACAVLDVLGEEHLLDNTREVGAFLVAGLRRAVDRTGAPAEVRGTGLMIGMEMLDASGAPDAQRARALVAAAVSRGLLLIGPIGLAKNVVRISPPLVITREQAEEGIAILEEALAEVT